MPSATRIQKDVFNVIDQIILPQMRQESIIQCLAGPPFHFANLVVWSQQQKLSDQHYNRAQIKHEWHKEHLISLREPLLRFIYEGTTYERIGITEMMAKNQQVLKEGIVCVQIPSPGIICFDSHMPQGSGALRSNVKEGVSKSILIKMMGNVMLVSLCVRNPPNFAASHNLEIYDPGVLQLGKLYLEELRIPNNDECTQAQLFAFFQRLKRIIRLNRLKVSNSSWIELDISKKTQRKNDEMIWQLIDYMQINLHKELTLEKLARHSNLSPSHLNRLFRQSQNTSVMHFLTKLRIDTAKDILCKTSERISDVALLVGFRRITSFSAAFHKHTGYSPSEYRHLHRKPS